MSPEDVASTPGPSSAIPVPVRQQDSSSSRHPFFGSVNHGQYDDASHRGRYLVGSPDQLNPYDNDSTSSSRSRRPDAIPFNLPSNSNSYSASNFPAPLGTPISTRPSMGGRSTSSPLVRRKPSGVGLSGSAQRHGITSAILGGSLAGGEAPKHQWTLFEQLMENEGQLRSPGGRTGRRPSRSGRSDAPDSSGGGEASAGERDPFLDVVVEDSPGRSRSRSPIIPTLASVHEDTDSDSDTSGGEYDSDSSATSTSSASGQVTPTGPQPPAPPPTLLSRIRALPSRLPTLSVLHRNILKCAIAYFVASLFTFNPYLSGLMSDLTTFAVPHRNSFLTMGKRPTPSGHMVATMYVLFLGFTGS